MLGTKIFGLLTTCVTLMAGCGRCEPSTAVPNVDRSHVLAGAAATAEASCEGRYIAEFAPLDEPKPCYEKMERLDLIVAKSSTGYTARERVGSQFWSGSQWVVDPVNCHMTISSSFESRHRKDASIRASIAAVRIVGPNDYDGSPDDCTFHGKVLKAPVDPRDIEFDVAAAKQLVRKTWVSWANSGCYQPAALTALRHSAVTIETVINDLGRMETFTVNGAVVDLAGQTRALDTRPERCGLWLAFENPSGSTQRFSVDIAAH
jgi:hypothetical protein